MSTEKMSPEELAAMLDNFNGDGVCHCGEWHGLLYTSGVSYLCEQAESFWLIDAIASHQRRVVKDKMLAEFQIWHLVVRLDQSADLICYKDTDIEVFRQRIEYTSFPQLDCRLYLENGVLMLPSER